MSHNVEKMMFTGKTPWWYGNNCQGEAIGVDLGEGAVTSEVAIERSGLDWSVRKRPAAYLDPATEGDRIVEVPDEFFLVRDSDNSVLGRCTADYTPYQNAAAFSFLDSLVADGELLYHTAGSLELGRRVWILAQTPHGWTIARKSGATNTHKAFVLAMLGHSGDIGISLMGTEVRAECANTCGFADERAERENLVFRIAHRGNIEAKLQLAAQAIKVIGEQVPERRAVLQSLAQQAMTTDAFVDFATEIFLGLDGDAAEVKELREKFYTDATDRSRTIMENKVAKVVALAIQGQGNEGDSSYDMLQGFTEYFDHFDLSHIQDNIEKGKRAAKAVTSSWVGAGAQAKNLVYKRLRESLR